MYTEIDITCKSSMKLTVPVTQNEIQSILFYKYNLMENIVEIFYAGLY